MLLHRNPKAERAALILASAYVFIHLFVLTAFPAAAKALSYVFLILAPMLAATATLACGLRSRFALNWLALAAGLVLWACGMAAGFYMDVIASGSDTSGLSIFFYVLYGVPLIFAAASPRGDVWTARVIDAVLAVVLGGLFLAATFIFASVVDTNSAGQRALSLMLDVENIFILAFNLLRYRASDTPAQKDFFRVASVFSGAYLLAAAYINHFAGDSTYGALIDIVIDAPFLLLFAMASRRIAGPLPTRAPLASKRLSMVMRTVSPIMLPLSLFAVSCLLIFFKPWCAVAGFITTLLGYSARTVLMQLRVSADKAQLEHLTRIDPLTELANRRHFDEMLSREFRRASRSGQSLSLLMVDIDHFKAINDTYGHLEGDTYLRQVSRRLAACASRGSDLVARYGGEEFAVILPDIGEAAAMVVAQKMLSAVVGLAMPSPAARGIVTISIGLASTERLKLVEGQQLLAAADAALYEAKSSGRNRVMVSAPTPVEA